MEKENREVMLSLCTWLLIAGSIVLGSCGGDTGEMDNSAQVEDTETNDSAQVEDTETNDSAQVAYAVSGSAQKGPFQKNSLVRLFELDAAFNQTGTSFQTEINNNFGKYLLPANLSSQYVELYVTGFYFDEIAGSPSVSQITLDAVADVSVSRSNNSININILSTLAKKRMLKLLGSGMSYLEAENQAANEVLNAFGIEGNLPERFQSLDLLVDGDSNAKLLAVSAILMNMATIASEQSDNVSAFLSIIVSNLGSDIEDNGILDDMDLLGDMQFARNRINVSEVRTYLENYFTTSDPLAVIPEFEKYIGSTISDETLTLTASIPLNFDARDIENSVMVSPDGSYVYVRVSDSIAVIDAQSSTVVRTFEIGGNLSSIAIDDEGAILYAVAEPSTILGIDTATGVVVKQLDLDIETSLELAGVRLAVLSGSILYVMEDSHMACGIIHTIDTSTMSQIGTSTDLCVYYPSGLALSADKSRLYIDSDLGNVQVLSLSNDTLEKELSLDYRVESSIPTPDGEFFYAESPSGLVLVDVNSGPGTVVKTFEMSTNGIYLSPDGSRLYAIVDNGTLVLMDTLTHTVLTSLQLSIGDYYTIIGTPDGSQLYIPRTDTNELYVVNVN